MKLIKLTKEEILANEVRNYNPTEWTKIVNRKCQYGDVEFYMAPKDEVHQYDRFFAVYTIPEGIKLLNTVSYTSCLSNAGFASVLIFPTSGEVITREFNNGKTTGRLENCKHNRLLMAKLSQERGTIFTNCI